eukprot:COSAG02_NODE_2252_length_9361_cov_26.363097_3_plen_124_part_00
MTDVASAKAAAKSVGDVAKKEGLNQLTNLAGKYFGGAGTPEQGVKACMFNVTTLRKIVTKFRRDLNRACTTHLCDSAGAWCHICSVLRTWCHIWYYIPARRHLSAGAWPRRHIWIQPDARCHF